MICISCGGDGYLVFSNGRTKECYRCNGTGEINDEEEE
ncbi:YuiA family protein [Metabacillus sp. B2-18]